MRKLHKRTIFVASSVGVTAATIGISAGVVYATNDTLTKAQIAQNVEHSLEDRMFGTIKLRPASKSGSFHEGRLEESQDKLKSINKDLEVARKAFTVEVKSRLPMYGIINDVLNVSSRFTDWDKFIERVIKAINGLNDNKIDVVEDALFDFADNGKNRLLSASYGTTKDDLKNVKDVTGPGGLSYKAENTFTSFEDYTSGLREAIAAPKSTENDNIIRKYKQTIVSVLRMMAGSQTELGSLTQFAVPKASGPEKNDSIVYMLQELKSVGDANNNDAKDLLVAWNKEILPAWNRRYEASNQFYDDSHEPFANKNRQPVINLQSTADLDAFKNYDAEYRKTYPTASVATTIDKFLDGEKLPGSKKEAGGFITNWEFLRLFFGDAFESAIAGKTPVTPSYAGDRGIDALFKASKAPIINRALSATGNGNAKTWWNGVVSNIFAAEKLPTEVTKGNWVWDRSLGDKLKMTDELESKYAALQIQTNIYNTEVAKIKSDSFAIGIKLKDLQEVVSQYKLEDGWQIKINSLVDGAIDQTALNKLIKSFQYDDGELRTNTPDYVIDKDGYIFPTDSNWLLRSTDTLNLENINFKDSSKLQPFEHEEHTITVFKPYIRINEDADKVSIDILWDHITGDTIGGHNDK